MKVVLQMPQTRGRILKRLRYVELAPKQKAKSYVETARPRAENLTPRPEGRPAPRLSILLRAHSEDFDNTNTGAAIFAQNNGSVLAGREAGQDRRL